MFGFNFWDIFLGAACLWFIIRGMMRGLIGEAVSLVGFLLSFYLAFNCHSEVGAALSHALGINGYIASVIGGVGIWIVVSIIASILRMLLQRAVGAAHLGFLDRLLGFVSGAIKSLLLIYAVITVGLLLSPVVSPTWLTRSTIIRQAGRSWPAAHTLLSALLPEGTTLPDGRLDIILRPYRTGTSGPSGYKIRNYR